MVLIIIHHRGVVIVILLLSSARDRATRSNHRWRAVWRRRARRCGPSSLTFRRHSINVMHRAIHHRVHRNTSIRHPRFLIPRHPSLRLYTYARFQYFARRWRDFFPWAQPLGRSGGPDPQKFGWTTPTFLPLRNTMQCTKLGIPSIFCSV